MRCFSDEFIHKEGRGLYWGAEAELFVGIVERRNCVVRDWCGNQAKGVQADSE